MALCLYLAMLDRTPRAYAFLLAGYTTSLIGFPAVMVPGDVFTIAITRVQEIAIGILAATLVHALVLPRRVSMRVHARVAAVLDDAERWTRDMRAGASDTVLATDRSKVAADLLELHVLSIHLPYDSAHGVAQVQILRALHDRMLDVLMLSSAVEDSIDRLRSPQAGAMDATGWRDLLRPASPRNRPSSTSPTPTAACCRRNCTLPVPTGVGMCLPALRDMCRVRYFTGIIGLPCAARWARSPASC